MTRRARGGLIAGGVIVLALAAFLFFGGNWLAKRQLVSAAERATGLPCSVGSLRLSPGGAEITGLRVGREPGAVVEVDRLSAEGSLYAGKLSSLSVRDGVVRVRLDDGSCSTLTGVEFSAAGLEALARRKGTIQVAASGNCADLNSLLAAKKAKVLFTRGHFAVRGELGSLRRGQDIPLRVRLENFQVKSVGERYTSDDSAASVEALVHLMIDADGRMKLDARELASFLGVDLSPRK